jgi:tight adherence protein C
MSAAVPHDAVLVVAATAAVLVTAVATAGSTVVGRRLSRPQRRLPDHAAADPDHLAAAPTARRPGRGATAVASLVGITAAALIVGALAVIGIWVSVVIVRRLRPIRAERRRRAQSERSLPAAMDLLVLSVRAGLTPQQAAGELASTQPGPVGEAFTEVIRRTQRGQLFADALGALGELLGPGAGALADVIAASDRHGLALGPTLDQLAFEAAAARQRLDQADARRLPVKLSFPLVTCTLPSFVLLAIVPAMIAALSSLGGPAW